MKTILAAALASAMLYGGAVQAKEDLCIPHRRLTIAGVEFMGPSAPIAAGFGKPVSRKRWYRESDGNEGSYHLWDLRYPGIVFSVRDGKGEYDRVQGVLITAARPEVPGYFRIGSGRDEVLRLLGFDARKHVRPRGAFWTLAECESEGFNYVEFSFDRKGRLNKVNIEYDSDSI